MRKIQMASIMSNAMLIMLLVSGIYGAPPNKPVGQDVKAETEQATRPAIVHNFNNTLPSEAVNFSREGSETNPPSTATEVLRTETVAKAGVTVSPKKGTLSPLAEWLIRRFRAKHPIPIHQPTKTSSVLPQKAQSQNDEGSVTMESTTEDGVTALAKTETEASEDEKIIHKLVAKIATVKPATSTSTPQTTTTLMTTTPLSKEVQSPIHEGSVTMKSTTEDGVTALAKTETEAPDDEKIIHKLIAKIATVKPATSTSTPQSTTTLSTEVQSPIHEGSVSPAFVEYPENKDMDEDYEEDLTLLKMTFNMVEKRLKEANVTLEEAIRIIIENSSEDVINILKELPDISYDDKEVTNASTPAEEMTGNVAHHLEADHSSAGQLKESFIVPAMIVFAISSLKFL